MTTSRQVRRREAGRQEAKERIEALDVDRIWNVLQRTLNDAKYGARAALAQAGEEPS